MANVLGFSGHTISIITAGLCLVEESSLRGCVNKWMCLCANKTLFIKASQLELDHRPEFGNPW